MAALSTLTKKIEALKASREKIKEKASAAKDVMIGAAITAGTAGALGLAEGYSEDGGIEIAGIPLPLGVGIGGHAIGVVSGIPEFHHVGNGALAAWTYVEGRAKGKELRDKMEDKTEGVPRGRASIDDEIRSRMSGAKVNGGATRARWENADGSPVVDSHGRPVR